MEPHFTILRYNLATIEKKILDSITQETMDEPKEPASKPKGSLGIKFDFPSKY